MELDDRLESYCRQQDCFAPECRVRRLRRLTGGWECEVHAFDLEGTPGPAPPPLPLVLRLYEGDGAGEKAWRELHCLKRLHDLDYPVPRTFRGETSSQALGRPFLIMERIDGEVLGSRLPRLAAGEQEALLARFCQLFARLHALPAEGFREIVPPIDPADPGAASRRAVRSLEESIAEHRLPGFRPILEWLENRGEALACARLAPAHLDFHPYNVIRTPADRLVVLDWTAFALTDFRLDLAWTLTLAQSFEGAAYRERLRRNYEEAIGSAVAGLEPFEVIAGLRRLVDLAASLTPGGGARLLRPEAVAAMRRMVGAHRRVYQLLLARTGLRVPEIERLLADLVA